MPTLTNWNGEIQFEVADDRFETPTQVSDVQAIVKNAFQQKQQVTVIGAMHSTTECMRGAGIVISMKDMARILSVDREQLTATVQGGVTLHQLCSHLKELGLRPPVILEFGNFQIGAISGTHANDTSVTTGAQFSSFVIGVKLVTPTGDIMKISETENTDYLPAIRSHFGMFGVVCEVTLRVFKSQPLQVTFQTMEVNSFLQDFAGNLKAMKGAYDQVFGMLFPHTRKLLWQCRKFVQPQPPSPLSLHTWIDPIESKGINLFKDVLLPLVKAGTAMHPSAALFDLLNAALVDLPLKIIHHSSYTIDPCDRAIIYSKDDPGFDFYDWVFPEEKWPDMAWAFLQLSDRFREEQDFALPLPALIYFIEKDEA